MTARAPHELSFALYNPDWVGKQSLIQQFVVRQGLFDLLAGDLRKATLESGLPHHLLVGQRGMGKTTMLRRLRYAIEDEPTLERHWIALTFPEDQYNVAQLSNFWLNCLDALSDSLDRRGQSAESQAIDKLVDQLEGEDEVVLAKHALAALLGWSRQHERGLVLLVDNIDLILDRLDHDQHWTLRETLSHESRLAVIGTSVAPPAAAFDYQDAFYDFFQVHELKGLNREDASRMLLMLAERDGAERVRQIVREQPERISTLHVLTGGNPRTLASLFQVLAATTDGNVMQDVEHLLDESTPLYKARVEALAPQAQQVFDKLALNWDPCTAADLAAALRMDVNKVSTQLNRLAQDGIIEKVAFPPESKTGFQVAERFFNIWYLMRGSRRVRRRLLWLVEFLKLFYGAQEFDGHARRWLERGDERRFDRLYEHGEMSLAFSSAVEDRALAHTMERHGVRTFAELCRHQRRNLSELLDLDGDDAHLKPVVDQLELLEEARRLVLNCKREWPDCTAAEFWNELSGSLSLTITEKYELAKTCSALSIEEIKELRADCCDERTTFSNGFGLQAYEELVKHIRSGRMLGLNDVIGADEASLGSADTTLRAIARAWVLEDQFQQSTFDELGNLLVNCTSATPFSVWAKVAKSQALCGEAEAAYRRAIEINPKDAYPWLGLGNLLQDHLARYSEAEAAYRRAIEIDPKFASPWNALGNLMTAHLGRYAEAEAAYRRAIEGDSKYANPWNGLGNLLQYHIARHDEAEAAYRRAIEIEPKDSVPWHNLGDLLQYRLARYDEAEAAYRHAIGIDPKFAYPWNGLGDLLQDHLARYDEAEAAYRRAVEIDTNLVVAWKWLGHLYSDKLHRPAEAEAAYRSAVRCGPNDVESHNSLAWSLFLSNGNLEEAETLGRRAVELDPSDLRIVHTLACILVRRGKWEEARTLIRRMLVEGTEAFFDQTWHDIVFLFREIVASGCGESAVELLDETEFGERWRPLREAVLAAARRDENVLWRVAPEVRQPAQELLKQLLPNDPTLALSKSVGPTRKKKATRTRISRRRRRL